MVNLVGTLEGYGLVLEVDLHILATYDAALAPAAGHESRVGGHTALHGEDTCGSAHTLYVLR